MLEDKELEELLKPIPFKHNESNFFSACGIDDKRAKGVFYVYEKLRGNTVKKRSEVIEFIENALDLTKREQLVLAFKTGQMRKE